MERRSGCSRYKCGLPRWMRCCGGGRDNATGPNSLTPARSLSTLSSVKQFAARAYKDVAPLPPNPPQPASPPLRLFRDLEKSFFFHLPIVYSVFNLTGYNSVCFTFEFITYVGLLCATMLSSRRALT